MIMNKIFRKMKKREGESIESWLRSNRFFSLKDQWYFSTREGIDYGPFSDREEAAQELQAFINELNNANRQAG